MMNISHLTLLALLLFSCQPIQSNAQKPDKIKIYNSAFGKAVVDFTKKGSFLLTNEINEKIDTILYWPQVGNVTSIWDVKLYSKKCILLLSSSYNFVDIYVFKQVSHQWVQISSMQLMNLDEPHDRNEPKQTIIHKSENNVQVFQGSKLIRECIIDYDKNTCQIIEYLKN